MVLMDHMMPVIDGMEALKLIKERNLCQGVPVVVLTANVAPGAKEEYLKAGFDDYLTKPVIPQQLESAIKRHLPKRLILERWERGGLTEEKPENDSNCWGTRRLRSSLRFYRSSPFWTLLWACPILRTMKNFTAI